MANLDVARLVDEIVSNVDEVGELEAWVKRRLDGTVEDALLDEAFGQVTQRWLGAEPPQTALWEHLVVVTAAHSTKPNGQHGYEACKSAIARMTQMVEEEVFRNVSAEVIVSLASALTLTLAAQRRLHQPIEVATGALGEKFSDSLADMAELCQNIWQRHGQMSGSEGLYVWDLRRKEWRLRQDFKPFRPTSN